MEERSYWDLTEAVAWLVTRDLAQVNKAYVTVRTDIKACEREFSLPVVWLSVRRLATQRASSTMEEDVAKLINMHGAGRITLWGCKNNSSSREEIPRPALSGFVVYTDHARGAYLTNNSLRSGERWHDVVVSSVEMRSAFPPETDAYATQFNAAVQATVTHLKPASTDAIRKAVIEVYDVEKSAGRKPPNKNELVPIVKARLSDYGQKASKPQIQEIADEPEISVRRGPVGKHTS